PPGRRSFVFDRRGIVYNPAEETDMMNAIPGALALLALFGQAPPQEQWKDAHRLILRNGNFIDGVIEEMTPDIIILRYSPTSVLTVQVSELKRDANGKPIIEEIRLRHVNTEAKRVAPPREPEPTAAPTPSPDGAKPVPTPEIKADRPAPPVETR